MGIFESFLNRLRGGEFNYERMGNIPEVKKRTNTILNDPRQMLLNTDANYSNMGSYVPNMPTPQEPQQPDFRVPSQMPGAMGGGFGHGIAGDVADIQKMPYRYGDQTGGIQQMPHRYGQQGGFNIMNPFTYGNMNRAIEGTRAGDKNMEYSDSPAGQIGKAANERNRLIQQMLGGY